MDDTGELGRRHFEACFAGAYWHVYRGEGRDRVLVGAADTEEEAYALALRLGADQIQEGTDGRVVSVVPA